MQVLLLIKLGVNSMLRRQEVKRASTLERWLTEHVIRPESAPLAIQSFDTPMPLTAGTRLGPHEILAAIGAGGMGEVYKARDTRLGRDVALKMLPDEVAGDASRRHRFEQEARAVAALNHPNIVAIYDVGENYLVTELVDGESLRGAKFGARKAIEVAVQIAEGLASAHSAGIVHRDLKPDNIMLTREGRAKILDFGLAKQTAARSASEETVTVATDPGTVMGTVTYMSPEQVRGDPPDYRSDIFSFGLILYELLTGERAFQGETAVDTMRAILRQDAPELPEAVPAPVRQIVTRCLEKDPRNRFQSTKDLAFALTQTGGQSGSQSAKTAALPVRSKRSRLAAVALAGVALLVLGIVAGRLMSRAPAATQWSAVRLVGLEIAMDPHLSPDGHLLAFEAMVDGLSQVAVMKPESGNWSVLTHRRDYG